MRSLGALIAILAALALPLAAASPVDDALAQAEREAFHAYQVVIDTYDAVVAPFSSPPPGEAPAPPPPPPAPGPEPREEAPPAEEPAREEGAAPPARAYDPLLGPVSRLVPVPVTDVVGPLPRIDVGRIAHTVLDAAPVAPASAPAPASAAPSASGPSGESAPAMPAAGSVPAGVVLAGVVATAGAAAATQGTPAALWERFRRLGFLALLYSRIAKERLLDHGTRERLLDAIRAKPGLAVADLVSATGVPRNTVTYHLRVLEREGLASSTRHGRNRLFFAPGSLPQRASADALATLRHETTLAVARRIGAQPGVDQKALCGSLGLSPSLAHWHADRLVASGIVDKRREGRFVRYYPGAAYAIVEGRAA